jgi:hypothetical protein
VPCKRVSDAPSAVLERNPLGDDQAMDQHDANPSRPRTGSLTIEWVDAADPTDAGATPNFGWTLRWSDPPLEDERVRQLLQEVAESI